MSQPTEPAESAGTIPRPDLTDYDFSSAQLYMSREDGTPLRAEQLHVAEVIEQPWGVQEMVEGDWVVLKPSASRGVKKSGVRREAFEATYDCVAEGLFVKRAFIKAVKIGFDFQIVGIDSDQPETVAAGKYLALNLDRNKQPIIVGGKRDILFYKEKDIIEKYQPVV